MPTQTQNSQLTWPEFAVAIYDKLTGRGAEVSYTFDNFEVWVPSVTGTGSDHAHWKMSGTVKIKTRDASAG